MEVDFLKSKRKALLKTKISNPLTILTDRQTDINTNRTASLLKIYSNIKTPLIHFVDNNYNIINVNCNIQINQKNLSFPFKFLIGG